MNATPVPTLRFLVRDEPVPYNRTTLATPQEMYDYWRDVISTESTFEAGKESLIVIPFDCRMNAIGYNVVSVGSATQTLAVPREIFRPLIVSGATKFVLLHNHPSGIPTPSRADILLTEKIRSLGEELDIRLADHIICGYKSSEILIPYFSFQEAGLI